MARPGISQHVDQMVRCLHQISDHQYTVQKVVKSGSLGKGTALQDSDIDLVVYFNGLHSIQDLERARPRLLNLIKAQVRQSWRGHISVKKETSLSVSYRLPDGTEVDVLPAFNAEEELGSTSAIHRAMRNYSGSTGRAAQQFSASLAPMQIDFVKRADSRVKEAIRKLKEWKDRNGLDIRSYSLELLAIYLHKPGMSTDDLYRKCMGQLAQCGSLQIAFNEHYNSSSYVRRQSVPYILDPVSPYNNTLHGVDTKAVSRAANAYFN